MREYTHEEFVELIMSLNEEQLLEMKMVKSCYKKELIEINGNYLEVVKI
jgi:hypothetical protein